MQQQIIKGLQGLGFSQNVKGIKGVSILPQNCYVGEFNGENVQKVRDDLFERVMTVFTSSGAKATVFMNVGQTWTWAFRGT
jgi:predicted nuclease of restriction endonuclease-like RecB superfamily